MRIAEEVTFGGSGLERAAHLRGDEAAQARMLGDPAARVLPVWRGKPLFADEAHEALHWVAPGAPILAGAAAAPFFIGIEEDGAPVFAQDVAPWEPEEGVPGGAPFLDQSHQPHPDAPPGAGFADLRVALTRLSPRALEIVASARALLNWHASHGFCARCGAQSVVAMAGWQRNCPGCRAVHFPRTDPVVIMLVTHGNSVLIGRSPGWPEGMFSLLAGFVEPGEPIEAAVRRETFEETGIRIGRVSYLSSQPWPFPNSLMIGCRAEALDTEITLDPKELDAATWLTREEMAEVMAGTHATIRRPRRGAIAQFLLHNWLADRLD